MYTVIYYLTVLNNGEGVAILDNALLTRELLDAFNNINRKKVLSEAKFILQGEDLFLVMLSEMGGVSTPSKVVEDSEFSPARLSAILKALESKGYIEKKQDEIDKRCTIIEITAKGLERSSAIKGEMIGSALRLTERLGEEDATELIRLIKKLVVALSEC